MKTITMVLWVAVLCTGSVIAANAQKPSGNLEVMSSLHETSGTYDERKLCRQFLEQYMKDCPYITDFSIREVPGATDNHVVEWQYRVDSWDQITQFYGWLAEKIKSPKKDAVKMALSPYGPDYSLGGKMWVSRTSRKALAKH